MCSELDLRINKLRIKRNNVLFDWTAEKLGELDDDIEDLQKRVADQKLVRNPEEAGSELECKNFQHKLTMMQRNRFKNIVKERRLKTRKVGSGRKKMMDESDERYLLRMIETKSVAYERRGDEVCYTNRRVKKRDFKRL